MSLRLFSLAAAVAAVMGLLTACGDQDESQAMELPDTTVQVGGPPGCIFESLPVMVATSDAVVYGRVTSAEPGPVVSRTEQGTSFRWRELSVSVEKEFYGDVGSDATIEQSGYEGEVSHEYATVPWLYPGDRAIFFLRENSATGNYKIMLDGEWRVDEGTVSTFSSDPAVAGVDGQSLAMVTSKFGAASKTAQAGDAESLIVPHGDPDPTHGDPDPMRCP